MMQVKDAEKEVLINEIVQLKAENLVLKQRLHNTNEALEQILSAIKEFVERIEQRNHDESLRRR